MGGFTEGTVNPARRDQGLGIRRPHPVDSGVDVAIRDSLAVADDHDGGTLI